MAGTEEPDRALRGAAWGLLFTVGVCSSSLLLFAVCWVWFGLFYFIFFSSRTDMKSVGRWEN